MAVEDFGTSGPNSFNNPTFGVASSSLNSTLTENQTNGLNKPNQKTNTFRYPKKLKIEKDTDYLEILISEYKPTGLSLSDGGQVTNLGTLKTGSDVNKFEKPKCFIYLPIPQNIRDTNQVDWGAPSFNPLQAYALGAASGVINNPTEALQNAVNGMKNIGLTESDRKGLVSVITNKLINQLGANVTTENVLAKATGQIFNPNMELLFNGVNIRSFPFVFDLAPRNQDEAMEIKNIIRNFKKSMVAKTSGGAGIFIRSPDVFKLTYKKGGNKHPFLNTFKPMALIDMTVDYTASGTYATYWDGSPVHMQLTLVFKELNPVYAEDYDQEEASIGVGY